MGKIIKFLSRYNFWLILIFSIPAVWALFVHGYYGASDDLHIAWLYEMDRALNMGQFPPRFVPDLSFGYGYPLFNFVFPLPFYIGEIFHKLGLNFVESIKAVFVLTVPLSMYFMYKFLREYTDEILSFAGGVLYVYTPYRATDIYVRGSIGEIFAFVFPPLIALSIVRISKKPQLKWIGILALAVAGLVLSHNIMAYMFMPFLIALILIERKNWIQNASGIALGLIISIYFWAPAIIESSLLKYSTVFNFIDHFPTIKQLITPYFGYGASVPGPYDGMSFFLGAINILLIIAAIVFIRGVKPVVYWALAAFAISIFMMNYRSTIIWNSVPFLPYFQFPWRFLSLTTFSTSILVIVFDKLKFGKYIGLAIILGAVALNFTDYKPQDFLGRTDAYYINRYVPYPVASAEYLKTGEEYLRLPVTTEFRPDKVSPNTGINNSFSIVNQKDIVFNYYKYYFPGWVAKVDGKPVEITAGRPYGQVSFTVPAGPHRVNISFGETTFRLVTDIVSLLGLVVAAGFIIIRKRIKPI